MAVYTNSGYGAKRDSQIFIFSNELHIRGELETTLHKELMDIVDNKQKVKA